MKYFGEPWPSGVCDDGEPVETPVGQTCLWCDDLVDEHDQGVLMPSLIRRVGDEYVPTTEALHKECLLRTSLGSIGHLTGNCSCYKPAEESFEDPPGLSKREAAHEVWEYWSRGGHHEKHG